MNHACQEMQERIIDYVLGLLDEPEREAVGNHLDECLHCRQYVQALEQHQQALGALGEEVQAGMGARQQRAIEAFQAAAPQQERAVATRSSLGRLTRMLVAALVVLGVGITIGRLTAPAPVDVEQLRGDLHAALTSSLQPVVQQAVLTEVDRRLEPALTAGTERLKLEIVEEMRQDLGTFAADVVSGSKQLMDQRFGEFVQLLEAARRTDRQRTARALEYIETNRRRDKTQIGLGLQSLAALTKPNPGPTEQ